MNKLQQSLAGMMEYLDRTVGVMDEKGIVLYASDGRLIGTQDVTARAFIASGDVQSFTGERTYRLVEAESGDPMICFVEGVDETSAIYAAFMANWVEAEIRKNDESVERINRKRRTFLRNVLLENELPGDIPLKAREYLIRYNARRLVLLLRMERETYHACLDALNKRFNDNGENFVLPMDEENIALMLDVGEDDGASIEKFLQTLIDYLKEEAMADVKIGVSMPAPYLKYAARAYREASLALVVGEIFLDEDVQIIHYDQLGLGRLIYQLPITLCELFIREVFEPGSYEMLDPETLLTIDKFFENSLNGSETSRQLFVHRNTLVYRLDKVERITGLDLRNFEDAVLFKLADMVRSYLAYVEKNKIGLQARSGLERTTDAYFPLT